MGIKLKKEIRRNAESTNSFAQEEVNLFKIVLETIPDGILIVDALNPQFPIIYANKTFEEITGCSQNEIIGRNLSCLKSGDSSSDVVRQIDDTLVKRQAFKGEVLYYRKDQSPFWVLLRISPVRDTKGVVTHFVKVFTDISLSKKMQNDFNLQRDELLHIARVGELGQLTSSIAHEINQPLTAILSNAQAAQRILSENLPNMDDVREIIRDIISDDKRAGEIIRKLRSLLKKKPLELEAIEVNQLVNETALLLSSDAMMKNKVIRLDTDTDSLIVNGDRIQLQQVIINLINNGLEAMVERGGEARELLIRTSLTQPQSAMVEVEDSGCGIPENKLETIFQPFYTTKPGGLGLGIPISCSIIQEHGGKLYCRRNPDHGATFYFTVPLIPGGIKR
jgi:PAS domain S-box-containing protein